MKNEHRSGELVMLDLPHSPAVYRQRVVTPRHLFPWVHPRAAWRALLEVFPWEAAAITVLSAIALVRRVGNPDGIGLAFCIGLPAAAFQMLRARRFVTASHIVWERGLLWRTRTHLPLRDIETAELEVHGEAGTQWGDIHLQTRSGPVTLWTVADPAAVWERLRALRDAGS
jgi:hypothetical protein